VVNQFGLAAELDAAGLGPLAALVVRVRTKSRSNSTSPPNTVSISGACEVVVGLCVVVAARIAADPEDVFFTSGLTKSNNLVLWRRTLR
jgi:hypothetical protein